MNPYDHPLVAGKKSAIHGTGGFAWVNLRKSKRIIESIGPKLSKTDSQVALDAGNAYIFTLDEDYDMESMEMVGVHHARSCSHQLRYTASRSRRRVGTVSGGAGSAVLPEYSYRMGRTSMRVSREPTSGINHQAVRLTTVSVAAFDALIPIQPAALLTMSGQNIHAALRW